MRHGGSVPGGVEAASNTRYNENKNCDIEKTKEAEFSDVKFDCFLFSEGSSR
jgi:hypothetical protein